MTDYFIYAHKSTRYFARISDRVLDDPNLIQVPSLPPDANHKWDGQAWIVLTPDEIEEIMEEAAEEDGSDKIEFGNIETSTITTPNSIVFWGNRTGDAAALASRDRLINSEIYLQENTLQIPYNLNLRNQSYLINGVKINSSKDSQKIIKTDRRSYNSTRWQLIPNLSLRSRNLESSRYQIEIELLLKTNRNNRDFEVALFINKRQNFDNSLNIDFNRGNDDKPIAWSDRLILAPNSLIEVYWRRRGSSVTCYVERRKLLIEKV